MNPTPSGPADDDDHCYDTALYLSAAKLDECKNERLAYTEIPVMKSASERNSAQKSALFQAMYYWVLSRS